MPPYFLTGIGNYYPGSKNHMDLVQIALEDNRNRLRKITILLGEGESFGDAKKKYSQIARVGWHTTRSGKRVVVLRPKADGRCPECGESKGVHYHPCAFGVPICNYCGATLS